MINKLDTYLILWGFPGSSVVKNPPDKKIKSLPSMQEKQVQSLGLEDPLEKEMVLHSSISAAQEIQWTEEPEEYSPWGC